MWVLWITGLPGSGKTEIARKTVELLSRKGIRARILELDEIRRIITPSPTYSEEEREIVYSSLAYMAWLLSSYENVIIDATGNRRRYRDLARKLIENFAEVYVRCSLDTCKRRESSRKAEFSPSNIYKRGKMVPGVGVPYEEPLNPELLVDSEKDSTDECARKIVDFICSRK
jgi:adenylylsulfate kinase